MAGEILFISDCHLDPQRPRVEARLVDFLDNRAVAADSLYILGDLFEVWLGDDDSAAAGQAVLDSLRRLARRVAVYFIAGNRDFLLGREFADSVGLKLLQEPQRLALGVHEAVLIHGDTLCTDDVDYQRFRALVRSPEWQAEFLARPLAERRRIAAQLRSDSVDAMAQKSAAIMDVNGAAVAECFRRHRVDTIIHGHTHRPAVHRYRDGLKRYVLGDWNPGPSYLGWDDSRGFQLVDPRA